MILSLVLWYLIGFFGFSAVCYLMDKQYTVRDMLVALPAGLMGPIVIVFGLAALTRSEWKFLDKRIL